LVSWNAKTPSLAKEGWPRHQEKWTEGTLFWRGRGGWFKDPMVFLATTTPSARSDERLRMQARREA
jgi:hypothetical protein